LVDRDLLEEFPGLDQKEVNPMVATRMVTMDSFIKDHSLLLQIPLWRITPNLEKSFKEEFKVGNVLPYGSFCLNEKVSVDTN
jgi:hypothetical protein